MIDRAALVTDLQKLLKRLEADLLQRSESAEVPEVGGAAARGVRTGEERPADGAELRGLAERRDHPGGRGLGAVLRLRAVPGGQPADRPAEDRRARRAAPAGPRRARAVLRARPSSPTTATTCCASSTSLAGLPGHQGRLRRRTTRSASCPTGSPATRPGACCAFFQKIDADAGSTLIHDFTDPTWDTRFLGDLYQDLSEAARKKYALLQTPEFVEEFILDRTLEPAIEEFGLARDQATSPAQPDGRLDSTTASA